MILLNVNTLPYVVISSWLDMRTCHITVRSQSLNAHAHAHDICTVSLMIPCKYVFHLQELFRYANDTRLLRRSQKSNNGAEQTERMTADNRDGTLVVCL